jgi:hypothetical protein
VSNKCSNCKSIESKSGGWGGSFSCAASQTPALYLPHKNRLIHRYTQVYTDIHKGYTDIRQYTSDTQIYAGIHRYTQGVHRYTPVYTRSTQALAGIITCTVRKLKVPWKPLGKGIYTPFLAVWFEVRGKLARSNECSGCICSTAHDTIKLTCDTVKGPGPREGRGLG